LSVEPILEAIDLGDYVWGRDVRDFGVERDPLDWVVVGGESGPGCRAMLVNWAREIHTECDAAGVAFYMKQLGGHPNRREKLSDLPRDLQVREFPISEVAHV
jgi:protein gp37